MGGKKKKKHLTKTLSLRLNESNLSQNTEHRVTQ